MPAAITPQVALVLGRTGTAYASRLTVKVEDAEVRAQLGNDFNGLEKVYANLTRKDGTPERVELQYTQTIDPAPGIGVKIVPNDGRQGPHAGGGPTLVSKPSGRSQDVYFLAIDSDRYQDVGFGKSITFTVETNKGELTAQAPSEVLWK